MKCLSRAELLIWLACFMLLIGFRLAHLAGPLDEPSWRQSWCAWHAREAARRGPGNGFVNYINFRGPRDVGAWTFPLYENAVALGYKIIGRESLKLARLLTLACYLAATYFLYRIVREMVGHRAGVYSALAFFAMPLGLFYSRAVHYEALLIALAHAFMLFALRFTLKPAAKVWLACAAVGVVAALIKPTFLVVMAPAILLWSFAHAKGQRMRSLLLTGFVLVAPVAAAVAHHFYRLHFEGAMMNNPLYADPYNPLYAKSWFWGGIREKFGFDYWKEIVRLTVWMVPTPAGAALAVCSLWVWRLREARRGVFAWGGWMIGTALYSFLFVRIVATHDYWRLPFMAPLAIAMSLGLEALLEMRFFHRAPSLRPVIVLGSVLLVGLGIRPAFRRGPYFQRDWQRIRAGEAIAQHTRPDELVLSSCVGRSTGPTDPRILNFADRKGWANRIEDLTPAMLKEYREAGVGVAAVLVTPEHLPLSDGPEWMLKCPRMEAPLAAPADGMVMFYRLDECECE